jgi:arsenite methyltransferase
MNSGIKSKHMKTNTFENDTVRTSVREHYGKVARAERACGCAPTCCSPTANEDHKSASALAEALGYSAAETSGVPDGANLGLGCGNPLAIASLTSGETVLDLGSGAGFDAFLAAKAVSPSGRVIGVDMTPEMLGKARQNAAKGGFDNVEFRLGEIERLPVANGCVDVIISNCVINLSPDKEAVFHEAFRVLKPGGRLAISDIVALKPMPDAVRQDIAAYSGCVGGAALVAELHRMLGSAGFERVRVTPKPESASFIRECFPGSGFEDYVASAIIEAIKPE